FSVVLELVPAELAAEVTRTLHIPTVGIGAGPHTDAQVLVWTDMLGLTGGRVPKFVKQYADLRSVLSGAAKAFAEEVVGGAQPEQRQSVHWPLTPPARRSAGHRGAPPLPAPPRQPAGLPPSAGCRVSVRGAVRPRATACGMPAL